MGNKITVKDPHTQIPFIGMGSKTPLASVWIGRLCLFALYRENKDEER
jgi:hypothetical protein